MIYMSVISWYSSRKCLLKLPLYFERDYSFFKLLPTDIFRVFCFSLSWKSSSWEKDEFESDFIFLRLPLLRKHNSPQRETGSIQIVLNILLFLINFDFGFLVILVFIFLNYVLYHVPGCFPFYCLLFVIFAFLLVF